jgi:hypothetical protein|uniref:Uncharacterized protein n=1 Tax=viral metagenome TaxID=1070528 RepID=A0A6C0DMN2_9ZZZZ
MISIKSYITDNTNIIDIYLMHKNKENIIINDDLIKKININFKKTKTTEMAYYCRNNYNYVYDLSNDSQYVYTRKLENTLIINETKNLNYYLLFYNEIKLPTHTFACTNELNSKYIAKITEFRINNRITLIIKNNNCYIQYKHSRDVDIDKIQEIINNVISKLNNL